MGFRGPEKPVVGKIGWSDDTVWLDAVKPRKSGAAPTGTIGFRGVPEEVWNFRIGGYQVCERWLKDRGPRRGRPGRTLTDEDITHYNCIVVALHESIRIVGEIDDVVAEYDGWPGAFGESATEPGAGSRR